MGRFFVFASACGDLLGLERLLEVGPGPARGLLHGGADDLDLEDVAESGLGLASFSMTC